MPALVLALSIIPAQGVLAGYTVVAGSTDVTIKGSTMGKLSKGKNIITAVFDDGTAVTLYTAKSFSGEVLKISNHT